MRLNPEPVTVVVVDPGPVCHGLLILNQNTHTEAFLVEHPRTMERRLEPNPKKIGNGNANGLGLEKTPSYVITGKSSNCLHLYNVGLVSISFFRRS